MKTIPRYQINTHIYKKVYIKIKIIGGDKTMSQQSRTIVPLLQRTTSLTNTAIGITKY